MSLIARQSVGKDGLNPSLTNAAAGGDTYENSGREFLYVENTDASSHDITISAQKSSYEDDVYGEVNLDDVQVSVPAGEFRLIGPVSPATYNNDSGQAEISYSSETGMKVAVLQLAR